MERYGSRRPRTVCCRCWQRPCCAAGQCGCAGCRSWPMWPRALPCCAVQAAQRSGRGRMCGWTGCPAAGRWRQARRAGCGHPSCSAPRCWPGWAGHRPCCPGAAASERGPLICIWRALCRWEPARSWKANACCSRLRRGCTERTSPCGSPAWGPPKPCCWRRRWHRGRRPCGVRPGSRRSKIWRHS